MSSVLQPREEKEVESAGETPRSTHQPPPHLINAPRKRKKRSTSRPATRLHRPRRTCVPLTKDSVRRKLFAEMSTEKQRPEEVDFEHDFRPLDDLDSAAEPRPGSRPRAAGSRTPTSTPDRKQKRSSPSGKQQVVGSRPATRSTSDSHSNHKMTRSSSLLKLV